MNKSPEATCPKCERTYCPRSANRHRDSCKCPECNHQWFCDDMTEFDREKDLSYKEMETLMETGFVKARFVSEWDRDTLVETGCEVNFATGAIQNIEESTGEVPQGSLTAEYVVYDDERHNVCMVCHEWLLKTAVVPDDVGKGTHEEEECQNPDCETNESPYHNPDGN